jgi:hypothetical protein
VEQILGWSISLQLIVVMTSIFAVARWRFHNYRETKLTKYLLGIAFTLFLFNVAITVALIKPVALFSVSSIFISLNMLPIILVCYELDVRPRAGFKDIIDDTNNRAGNPATAARVASFYDVGGDEDASVLDSVVSFSEVALRIRPGEGVDAGPDHTRYHVPNFNRVWLLYACSILILVVYSAVGYRALPASPLIPTITACAFVVCDMAVFAVYSTGLQLHVPPHCNVLLLCALRLCLCAWGVQHWYLGHVVTWFTVSVVLVFLNMREIYEEANMDSGDGDSVDACPDVNLEQATQKAQLQEMQEGTPEHEELKRLHECVLRPCFCVLRFHHLTDRHLLLA